MRYFKNGITIAAALMLTTWLTSVDASAHRRYGGGIYYGYGAYPSYGYGAYPYYRYRYYPSYYVDDYAAYPYYGAYYGGSYYYRRSLRHRYWR